MMCPNCSKENKSTNIRCEFCSTQLIDENEFDSQVIFKINDNVVSSKDIKFSEKKVGCLSSILPLIFVGPWLLIGIVFLGVGLYASISEHNQTKGYEKTTAILKKYINCEYEDGSQVCNGIYEYEVNGINYTVSPNLLTTHDGFDEIGTVYYNPKNPSESVMYAGWGNFIIIGIIIISVAVVIFISKTIFVKKILKNKDNIS